MTSRSQLHPDVSDRDHADGPVGAPVTLVEYGDYECPHCGRAYPIVKQLQREFGPRLRFVFRNFPLTEIHEHAAHAAQAAEAAGAAGRYWPMHDLLFEHQATLDDAHLVRLAAQAGVDGAAVRAALADERHMPRVQEDFMSGVHSGVNGTPTFFINGRRHDDSWDIDTLRDAIEDAAG